MGLVYLERINRKAVSSQSPALPRSGYAGNTDYVNDSTPTGLRIVLIAKPNVAAARQPWAMWRDRFAVDTIQTSLNLRYYP